MDLSVKRSSIRGSWACSHRSEVEQVPQCHTGLCFHCLFISSLVCVTTVISSISFRNCVETPAITLTLPLLPDFDGMDFDTRLSSEQAMKQQELICRVWPRWS